MYSFLSQTYEKNLLPIVNFLQRDPRQRYTASPSQPQYPSSGMSNNQQQSPSAASQSDVMATLQSILSPANGNGGGDPTAQILMQVIYTSVQYDPLQDIYELINESSYNHYYPLYHQLKPPPFSNTWHKYYRQVLHHQHQHRLGPHHLG
jgi:hypothetical protein